MFIIYIINMSDIFQYGGRYSTCNYPNSSKYFRSSGKLRTSKTGRKNQRIWRSRNDCLTGEANYLPKEDPSMLQVGYIAKGRKHFYKVHNIGGRNVWRRCGLPCLDKSGRIILGSLPDKSEKSIGEFLFGKASAPADESSEEEPMSDDSADFADSDFEPEVEETEEVNLLDSATEAETTAASLPSEFVPFTGELRDLMFAVESADGDIDHYDFDPSIVFNAIIKDDEEEAPIQFVILGLTDDDTNDLLIDVDGEEHVLTRLDDEDQYMFEIDAESGAMAYVFIDIPDQLKNRVAETQAEWDTGFAASIPLPDEDTDDADFNETAFGFGKDEDDDEEIEVVDTDSYDDSEYAPETSEEEPSDAQSGSEEPSEEEYEPREKVKGRLHGNWYENLYDEPEYAPSQHDMNLAEIEANLQMALPSESSEDEEDLIPVPEKPSGWTWETTGYDEPDTETPAIAVESEPADIGVTDFFKEEQSEEAPAVIEPPTSEQSEDLPEIPSDVAPFEDEDFEPVEESDVSSDVVSDDVTFYRPPALPASLMPQHMK